MVIIAAARNAKQSVARRRKTMVAGVSRTMEIIAVTGMKYRRLGRLNESE